MNDLNSKKALRYLLASIMAAGACGQVNASTVSQTISYGYTQDGQLEKQTIEGSTIHYTDFSLHDKATQVELDGNKIIDYVSFGTNGKTKRIQFADSDYTHGIHRYTDFGALKSMTMVKGGQTVAEKSSLKYNAAGHVTKLYDFHDGKFYTHRFDYNATGNLQSFSINGIANDYYYNDAGALLGKSGMLTGDLSITPVPQRSVDANHQDTAWRYDNDGNLVEDDNYLYKYNSAGRLARIIDKFTLKWVSHYIYDSEGHRVRKMTPSTVTYYYRDVVGNLAQQKSYDIETGRLLNQERYITVNGYNMATVKLEDGEQSLEYQMNDRLGSQAVRWQDGQTAVSQMYSPFGEQMDKRSGRIHAGSYGFTQHEDDNEIQATYMKARYYQPTFGVMTRPDPARDFNIYNPASFNLYAYVGNDPVNAWDPTGLAAIDEDESQKPRKEWTDEDERKYRETHDYPSPQQMAKDGLNPWTGNPADFGSFKGTFTRALMDNDTNGAMNDGALGAELGEMILEFIMSQTTGFKKSKDGKKTLKSNRGSKTKVKKAKLKVNGQSTDLSPPQGQEMKGVVDQAEINSRDDLVPYNGRGGGVAHRNPSSSSRVRGYYETISLIIGFFNGVSSKD